MKPTSKDKKISITSYILLAIGLILYFLIGGYGLGFFPKGVNVIFVIIGILGATAFLMYYLNNNDN